MLSWEKSIEWLLGFSFNNRVDVRKELFLWIGMKSLGQNFSYLKIYNGNYTYLLIFDMILSGRYHEMSSSHVTESTNKIVFLVFKKLIWIITVISNVGCKSVNTNGIKPIKIIWIYICLFSNYRNKLWCNYVCRLIW